MVWVDAEGSRMFGGVERADDGFESSEDSGAFEAGSEILEGEV